jgi:sec-independent protein translocase protein TatC
MTTVDEPQPVTEGSHMTVWEHIAELRRRLMICIGAVMVGAVIAYLAWPLLLDFITAPFCRTAGECQLYATDPLAPFTTRLQVAIYGGVILAMPVLLWQVWLFVTPGLHSKERRYAIPFVLSALTLFAFGAAIAYVTLAPALDFLFAVAGPSVDQIPTVDKYLSLTMWMMLAFGIGFEFPVLLIALQLVGVLTPRQLASSRRWAMIVIVVVAAVITPSGDPISLLMLSVPMYILFEASILIGWLIARRRRKAAATGAHESLS